MTEVSLPRHMSPKAPVGLLPPDDLFSPNGHGHGHANGTAIPNGTPNGTANGAANGTAASPSLGQPKLNVTIQRRDSRARPPPIMVQTSSPQLGAGSLPTAVQTLVDEHEQEHEHDDEHAEEGKDNVGELIGTPNRLSFHGGNGSISIPGMPAMGLGLGLERPVTPTRDESGAAGIASPGSPWRPLETGDTYSPPARRTRTNGRPPSWHRNSLEVPNFLSFPHMPPSPTSSNGSTGPGARRFEPTPTHGLHARNLSAYFPQPGMPLPPPSPTLESPGDSMIPDGDRKAFGGPQDWQFGGQPPPGVHVDEADSPQTRRGKRRGHHHKHSLSHNFFSFLDPTQTNPNASNGNAAMSPDTPIAPTLSPAAPKPVPMEFSSPLTSTALSPLPPGKKDPQTQALGWFCVIESVLGVALWIHGQSSGWRSLTAVGYMIVFDAMGMGVNIWSKAEAAWRSIRRPYGSSRFTSLLCFSQSLFLLFAATYIAKESLETVLLGPDGHDHGGGHGHGDHTVGDERPFPYLLLGLASLASLFSGAVLGNNRKLVEATGELFLPSWYLAAVEANTFLTNPYTLSAAGTTAGLLIAGLVTPADALKRVDSAASLLLTLLTGALAWPPCAAFAQILLQTAPPAASVQMKALRGALREVADDRRVLGLGTFRCWAIDAGKPVQAANPGPPSAPSSRNASLHISSPSVSAFMRTTTAELNNTLGLFMQQKSEVATAQVPLVVTLVVHVHPETTDREVLDITRTSWTRLNAAVNGRSAGEGEVSVQVKRGWEGAND